MWYQIFSCYVHNSNIKKIPVLNDLIAYVFHSHNNQLPFNNMNNIYIYVAIVWTVDRHPFYSQLSTRFSFVSFFFFLSYVWLPAWITCILEIMSWRCHPYKLTMKTKQFDNSHRTTIFYSTLFVHDKIVDFIASLSNDACTITCPK